MTYGNQTLAAKPDFHSDPPRRGGFEVSAIRRFSNHCSELVEQQPENGLALAFVPAQPLGVVVEDGAGGATFEAAPRTVIEFMGDDFGYRTPKLRHCCGFRQKAVI